MGTQSEEDLRKSYEDARQKVEDIKSNWIREQVHERKFNHHSS